MEGHPLEAESSQPANGPLSTKSSFFIVLPVHKLWASTGPCTPPTAPSSATSLNPRRDPDSRHSSLRRPASMHRLRTTSNAEKSPLPFNSSPQKRGTTCVP